MKTRTFKLEKERSYQKIASPNCPNYGMTHLINMMGDDVIYVETGVCKGVSIGSVVQLCPNIKSVYGVDFYRPNVDEFDRGAREYDQATMRHAYSRAKDRILRSGHKDKITLILEDVSVAVDYFEDNSIDFLFLDHYLNEKDVADCLPMWYFFYANPIRDPLTLVHHANEDLELHPGTNRFIGRALRGTPDDWVPARLISIDSEPLLPLTGIRRVELEDARDFEYVNKHDFYDNTDLYRWSFGGYAPTARTWLTDCHDWSTEVLADVGGELQLSNGKRHYVNRLAPVKKRVRVTDYSGLYPAVSDCAFTCSIITV